jgi:hypothetical protein
VEKEDVKYQIKLNSFKNCGKNTLNVLVTMELAVQ